MLQNQKIKLCLHLVFSLVILLVQSCKKEEAKIDFHQSYFGLAQGNYWIYDVTEITHDIDAQVKHDTLRYFLKAKIGEVYIDNQGRNAYEYLRYTADSLSNSWNKIKVWTTILNQNSAELVEENERKVKLVFPISMKNTWNINAYNSLNAVYASYDHIHLPYTINNLSFDSTVTVNQAYYFTFVDFQNQFEVYANHVGLVYKHYKDLRINNFDSLQVEKGNELFYKLVQYGKE